MFVVHISERPEEYKVTSKGLITQYKKKGKIHFFLNIQAYSRKPNKK